MSSVRLATTVYIIDIGVVCLVIGSPLDHNRDLGTDVRNLGSGRVVDVPPIPDIFS